MRIVSAEAWAVEMPLRRPYAIAYDSYDRATNWFLRLETDSGLQGVGCAAPAPEVTGESLQACGAALDALGEALRGTDALAPTPSTVLDAIRLTPAAAAALDMAGADLRARHAGLPLHAYLGAGLRGLTTSLTLGIEPLTETLEQGRDAARRGFRALKIKGGRDVASDIDRVVALREALGERVALRFDANQGYSLRQALRFATSRAGQAVELLEQPTSAADPATSLELARALRASRAESALPPLLADEAALGPADVAELLGSGAADGVVIKLMKAGGLDPALRIDAIAAARRAPTMISCMDESALAIAAGLHLALAASSIEWVDLDGHLDLVGDPAAGAVTLRQGQLWPVGGEGLGVDPGALS